MRWITPQSETTTRVKSVLVRSEVSVYVPKDPATPPGKPRSIEWSN